MATQVQRRKGTTVQHSTFTGASAELTVDSTKNTVVVHDGATAGGFPLAKESGSALSPSSVTLSSGTANGVAYLNGSKVLTTGTALTFDGATLGVNGVSVGRGAGAVATNTAVGASALAGSNTGAYNTAIGASALLVNTSGQLNTAVGQTAMYSNTTGSNNSVLGQYALGANTTGSANTAVGYNALTSNTTASNNTAVGYQAAYSNVTGTNVTAIGYGSLYANTASNNTAVGVNSGVGNTTGSENTFIGRSSANSNTTGASNTALGYASLYSNTTASNNTAVGYQAGYSITTGSYNTVFGPSGSALGLTTGSYNLYSGVAARASSSNVSYEMVITSDSSATVGKGSSTGFMNPGSGSMYQYNNSASWATTSDQRLKKNITDNNIGLEKITAIQVRNFEYRLPEEIDAELKPTDAIDKSGVQLGVIAQELQQVLPECVKTESTGVMSIHTDNLIWYAINAIKELKAENESLTTRLAALEAK